jgi:hypothetical protein
MSANLTAPYSPISDVIVGLHAIETPGSAAAAAERRRNEPHGAQVVPAEFLDEFSVDADYAIAPLNVSPAGGYPWRRLVAGSKGCFGVVIAVHDRCPS